MTVEEEIEELEAALNTAVMRRENRGKVYAKVGMDNFKTIRAAARKRLAELKEGSARHGNN